MVRYTSPQILDEDAVYTFCYGHNSAQHELGEDIDGSTLIENSGRLGAAKSFDDLPLPSVKFELYQENTLVQTSSRESDIPVTPSARDNSDEEEYVLASESNISKVSHSFRSKSSAEPDVKTLLLKKAEPFNLKFETSSPGGSGKKSHKVSPAQGTESVIFHTCTNPQQLRRLERYKFVAENDLEKAGMWTGPTSQPPGEWTDAERDLLSHLSMRGLEPLVPSSWERDFPTFPKALFSPCGARESLIESLSGHEFRGMDERAFIDLVANMRIAIKALEALITLGPRSRDRQRFNLQPEPILRRILKSYIRWGLRDANLYKEPQKAPFHTIYTVKQFQSVKTAVRLVVDDLIALGDRHRRSWTMSQTDKNNSKYESPYDYNKHGKKNLPILTGFLICGCTLSVITLDLNPGNLNDAKSARFIAQFDFSEPDQDVWNSLAVAIAVVLMRNAMLRLKIQRDEAD
ncbi:hypothetical protein LOZ66_005459 [Ophidiomyces ophidiicola]|nr:hypothetical protein LOZ66_005459 [Ophidiomyces ophidiicola]